MFPDHLKGNLLVCLRSPSLKFSGLNLFEQSIGRVSHAFHEPLKLHRFFYFFILVLIRWPLFCYLHHQFTVLINYLCKVPVTRDKLVYSPANCVHVCERERESVCVCVCVYVCLMGSKHTHTHTHTHPRREERER